MTAKRGRPQLGSKPRINTSLSLDPTLWDRIKAQATKEGISASEWITRLATRALARKGRAKKR